jgi:amylosucrase
VDLALGRIFLLHAASYGYGGIPLLYMGDELGLRNDDSYLSDPRLAGDSRWVHRPAMPWSLAESRHDGSSVAGRIFAGLRHLARIRATLPALHAAVESHAVDVGSPAVLGLIRHHPAATILQVYNVSRSWQSIPNHAIHDNGLHGDLREHLADRRLDLAGDRLALPPYAAWWIGQTVD